MKNERAKPTSIDEYVASFPEDVQKILSDIRSVIRFAAPDAVEKLSYGMPTFWQGENLVHYAAYKHHIGFYPTPSGIEAFRQALGAYKISKGTVQFPIDKPIPYVLIKQIVKFRVSEIERKLRKTKRKK
ncbi:MAG: DUF1801 domain-containing protein [Spirochaetales bacterium]|nr:DUF1801 domain-containing protein [Spirochaetales bacterium]